MQWAYLGALLVAIVGMTVLDWRYRLAWWHDARRTARTLLPVIAVFIIWDIAGIALGVFWHGQSDYALPYTLAPEFPLEELFFLYHLCYTTLVVYRGIGKWRRI